MSIRIKRLKRERVISEINVVPYIDVMLVLLVIFMVTAPLITTGILNLPEVSRTAPKKENVVTVEIRGNESIKIKSPNDKLSKVVTPSTLLENIERIQSSSGNSAVVFLRKKCTLHRVLETIETLHSGGITRVGLLVKKKNNVFINYIEKVSERHITTGSYFRTGITVSALLHIGIFYLVYFFSDHGKRNRIRPGRIVVWRLC